MRTAFRLAFLIVEDHPLTRSGTRALLEHAYPGCLCQEVSSIAEARRHLERRNWSIVLLDLQLPDGSGTELLSMCKSPVLVLTMEDDPQVLGRTMAEGARGYVSKSDSPDRILEAIEAILSSQRAATAPRSEESTALSARERQVLRSLLDGRHQSDLAQELGISPTTVQSYKNRLFAKLSVDSVADLIKWAAKSRG